MTAFHLVKIGHVATKIAGRSKRLEKNGGAHVPTGLGEMAAEYAAHESVRSGHECALFHAVPRCRSSLSRSMSASTIMPINSRKETSGFQPSCLRALALSPRRRCTSAGR